MAQPMSTYLTSIPADRQTPLDSPFAAFLPSDGVMGPSSRLAPPFNPWAQMASRMGAADPAGFPYAAPADVNYNPMAGIPTMGGAPSVPPMSPYGIPEPPPPAATGGAATPPAGGGSRGPVMREEHPSDLEALYAEIRAKGEERAAAQRAGIGAMQQRLGATLGTELGYDLTPLVNYVNQQTGGSLGKGYVPDSVRQRQQDIAAMEAAISKTKDSAFGDELQAMKDQAKGLFDLTKLNDDRAEAQSRLALMREQIAVDREKIKAAAVKSPEIKGEQWNAAGFGKRMEDSHTAMTNVLSDPAAVKLLTSGEAKTKGMLPGKFQTPTMRAFDTQKQDFILAFLRDESGASIGTDEYNKADKAFFPQWGDTTSDVEAKNAKRARLVEARKLEAGPAWSKFKETSAAAPSTSASPTDDALRSMSLEDLQKIAAGG